MDTVKPIKPIPLHEISKKSTSADEPLTSAEQGKLWATFMGNTMGACVLQYMLCHVDDPMIRDCLRNGLGLSESFVRTIRAIYKKEVYPVPQGFTEKDVNLEAPRLFEDEFYLHYLKYLGKAGLSVYSAAIPLMSRPDIRDFFTECLDATVKLLNQVNEVMLAKGIPIKPSMIPYPRQVDFVEKQSYLNGFFGHVRPLQALEITHLHDNIENNATSKAVLIGFSQVAQMEQAKAYFRRGREIAEKHYDIFAQILEKEELTSFPILDPLVTTSTIPPFSDKLMIYHKLDMFAMRIRAYGNALSFSARHDIGEKYGRLILEVGNYVEDGANILIANGWMEQPPQAVDREALAARS